MKNILIVDDESEITTPLKIGLEDRGFSVDISNSPREVISNFKSGVYDLAIIDIRMPDINGFELYRELRKRDNRLVIWFLTAFDIHVKEFEKMFPDVDVNLVVRKPIAISDLAMKISASSEIDQRLLD